MTFNHVKSFKKPGNSLSGFFCLAYASLLKTVEGQDKTKYCFYNRIDTFGAQRKKYAVVSIFIRPYHDSGHNHPDGSALNHQGTNPSAPRSFFFAPTRILATSRAGFHDGIFQRNRVITNKGLSSYFSRQRPYSTHIRYE